MNDARRLPDIPGYTILRVLGRGGTATVYLAVQDRLDRRIALKVMQPAAMTGDDFAMRFVKEGRILARLTHPRIVTIHDLDSVGDLHYFSMEHLPGGDLADAIKQGLTLERTHSITRQVAEALHFAHTQNVFHRDIKPQNILFRDDGMPVLTDFGIAKIVLAQNGMIVGSPRYMAPEEETLGQPTDHRADLYSLGIVLYEMLAGEAPYGSGDVVSLAVKHSTAPIPVLSRALVCYQPILERLIAKRPEDRFDSAAQLIDALDRLAADHVYCGPDEDEPKHILARQTVAPWPRPTAFEESVGSTTRGPEHAHSAGNRVGRPTHTSDGATQPYSADKVARAGPLYDNNGMGGPAAVTPAVKPITKPARPIREESDPVKAQRRSGERPPWLAIGLSALVAAAAVGGIWWLDAATELNLPWGAMPPQTPETTQTPEASPSTSATPQQSERSLGLSVDQRRNVQQ